MKPHIKFSSARRMLSAWECLGVTDEFIFIGHGDTPRQAYEDYMSRVVYRGGDDVRPGDLS